MCIIAALRCDVVNVNQEREYYRTTECTVSMICIRLTFWASLWGLIEQAEELAEQRGAVATSRLICCLTRSDILSLTYTLQVMAPSVNGTSDKYEGSQHAGAAQNDKAHTYCTEQAQSRVRLNSSGIIARADSDMI